MTEWIDVKDRLPEEEERVLTYCPGLDEIFDSFELGLEKVDLFRATGKEYISHWMPFPKPPKNKHQCVHPITGAVCLEWEPGMYVLIKSLKDQEFITSVKFCPFCGASSETRTKREELK